MNWCSMKRLVFTAGLTLSCQSLSHDDDYFSPFVLVPDPISWTTAECFSVIRKRVHFEEPSRRNNPKEKLSRTYRSTFRSRVTSSTTSTVTTTTFCSSISSFTVDVIQYSSRCTSVHPINFTPATKPFRETSLLQLPIILPMHSDPLDPRKRRRIVQGRRTEQTFESYLQDTSLPSQLLSSSTHSPITHNALLTTNIHDTFSAWSTPFTASTPG